MSRKTIFRQLMGKLFSRNSKNSKRPSPKLGLLELESRVVPATAVFAATGAGAPLLTITLSSGEAFDYMNEYRDPANNNALTDTAGYFKMSRWNSNSNSFEPVAWSKLTDSSNTWVNNQVGAGVSLDSIQLAAGKNINGINIKVIGGAAWDGAYFRANPDKADGVFSGTVTTEASVDDTVVQDYAFSSKSDINFLSPSVTAYNDILGGKNVNLTTAVGSSPVFYVEGARTIQAGGPTGEPGYTLTVNSTVEGASAGGAGQPLHRAILSNPGGTITLGSGAGGNLPNTLLDGLELTGTGITLKGSFYFAADHMRFHGPVTVNSATTAVFSVDNELLLEDGISAINAPKGVAFEVNGGSTTTINPLAGGLVSQFTSFEIRPVPGSDGAKVILASNIKSTASTGFIKLNAPTYLSGDTTLETTGSGTVQVAATGSIQTLDPAKPANLQVTSTQLQLGGNIGNENALNSLKIIGGIKTVAATSITALGDITQTGSTANIQVTGKLSATSQNGNISFPNFIKSADIALTGAIDFNAPKGKLGLYTGTTEPTLSLVDIKLNALTGIELSSNLVATGVGGISVTGPQIIKTDTTYTAQKALAPITVGGLEASVASGQSLTLSSAGGPVVISSGLGQAVALNNLTVLGASSLSVNGPVRSSGNIIFKADGLALKSSLTSSSITIQNATAGKTIGLGSDTGADIALDSSEVSNLVGNLITLGRNDSSAPTGLITFSGNAAFSAEVNKLQIIAPAGLATTNSGGVSVPNLAISSAKAASLGGKNSVGTLTGNFTSDFAFANLGTLNLGTSGAGVSVGGAGSISATGPITQGNTLSVTGLLDLSATAGLGKEQPITLTNSDNKFTAVRLGYAGDVKLVVAGDLALSQAIVTEGSSQVPALVGSINASAGIANRISLASNLDISGPVNLKTATPLALAGGTQIRSTAQKGEGITVIGGIADTAGKNLTLDAGDGTLIVDSISLTGGSSALTIPSLGGSSSIGSLKAGPVSVQNGTGSLNLGAPETISLSITAGSLGVTVNSVAKVGAISAYNTGTTLIGSPTTTLTMPSGSIINQLEVGKGITNISFPNGGTLIRAFTIRSGMAMTVGDSLTDILNLGGGLVIANGGILNGTAKIQGNITAESQSVYAPADQIIVGNLTLNAGSTLQLDATKGSFGTGNGPLTVEGNADVTGATLNLINSTTNRATKGSVLTALESTTKGTVTGTFANLTEGAKLATSSGMYLVSYTGGTSGHDITLTAADEQTKAGVYAVAVTGTPTSFSKLMIYKNGTNEFVRSIIPFPGFRGSFYVDSGDISGDSVDDIIVGSGNGSNNGHVVVFDGKVLADTTVDAATVVRGYKDNGSVRASLYAFIGYSSGVAVRLANLNGDQYADIVLAPGEGAGSVTAAHLRVWDGKLSMAQFENGAPFSSYNYKEWELASFWAFGTDKAPGGGLGISVIQQNDRDLIVASQLFGPGIKVFSYEAGLNGLLKTEQDLTNWAATSGNTMAVLDSAVGQRLYVSGGFARNSEDTVYVRNQNQQILYTIPNVFGGTKTSLRLGLKNVDNDSQRELLVTRVGSAETKIFNIDEKGFTLITTLNPDGALAGWV